MTFDEAIARMEECASGGDCGEPFYSDREAWEVIKVGIAALRVELEEAYWSAR